MLRVTLEFGPGDRAKHRCDSRNINDMVNNAYTDAFYSLTVDFRSSSAEVLANMIHNVSSIICQRIHSTGTNSEIVQLQHDLGSGGENILGYILAKLTEHSDNSVRRLGSCVAVMEASRRFSAALPIRYFDVTSGG
jgi:hypothetical protein